MKRLLVLLMALSLLLCGCGTLLKQPVYTDTAVFAMDTAMNLRIYDDEDGAAAAELTQTIESLEKTLSVTDTKSTAYALNTTGSAESKALAELVRFAQTLHSRTGGALDITVFPAVRLWGFTTDTYRIPQQEELSEVQQLLGMDKLTVSGDTVTLQPDSKVDFGALAKGYAADRCRELLEARELCGVLSLGGNVQTVGEKPGGGTWLVGIQNPANPSENAAAVRVMGSTALVTSGDYQRYFEYAGKRYCHIFDPSTASPVQSNLRSVTVICQSGVLADGLSTALFVMGLEKATAFYRASADFEAVFIMDDGTIYATEGLQDAVTDCTFSVITR